jgi:3-hydroxy-9,10-secoandrosta-1,3,5(10)-triene-9,17-dione monooxygenase reductase component
LTVAKGPSPEAEADRFRSLMGRFPTGVTIVTARYLGEDAGMTVNAFLSVSLEPPTVLISLNAAAETTPLVEASRRFAVNFLAADQRAISERFASRAAWQEKFEGIAVHRGITGAPLLDGALGTLECEVVGRVPHATHVLFLGRVLQMAEGPGGLPLVFWRGAYATPSQGDRLIMSPSRPSPPSSEGPAAKPPRKAAR